MSTTAQNVRQAAQQAFNAAQRMNNLVNNPKTIDNGILRLVIYGLLIPIAIFLWRNIRPYSAYMASLGVGSGQFLSLAAGTLAFFAVQYFEIWSWLLPRTADNRKRSLRNTISVVAYIVDTTACVVFWPAVKAGAPEGINIMLMSYIAWGNIATMVITIFGLALWFTLRKWARKAA